MGSGTEISTSGTILVEDGAQVTLSAPKHRFSPGLSVQAGARLSVRVTVPACVASDPDSNAPVTPGSASSERSEAAAEADSPTLLRADINALPEAVASQLARFAINPGAVTATLRDAAGSWLILETTQALSPADRNQVGDIYRLDLLSERLELVSRTPEGWAGNGASSYADADVFGERVVFQSTADNLAEADDNAVRDLFLHDLALGQMTRLTAGASGASGHPSLDGTAAVMVYDQRDAAGRRQIHRAALDDPRSSQVLSLTVAPSGQWLDNHHPAISRDGHYVVYVEERAVGEAQCQVHLFDLDTEVYHQQPCPAELAKASEVARPAFSANAEVIRWQVPGQQEALVLSNPLIQRGE